MADKIAVLRAGRQGQFAKPLKLYNRPENISVARFIGSPKMNFFAADVASGALRLAADGTVALAKNTFALREGARVTLGIRPNGLRPADEGLKLTVANVERLGGAS